MANNADLVLLKYGDKNSVTVHLHGATIISWKCNGQEVLFMSEKAVFDNKKAIRGGIPLVFPCFGPWELGPQHGFARISRWKLDHNTNGDDCVTGQFSLEDDDTTRAMWNHKFKLTYTLVLKKTSLEINFGVENKGADPFTFTCLLHTYFSVPDVTKAGVTGLKGYAYIDQVKKVTVKAETEDPVFVIDNYDRIYENTGDSHTVHNTAGGRQVKITKNNLTDTVLWNPWAEKAKAMSDFGDDQYPTMLCVEAGKVAEPVTLPPGGSFTCGQELAVSQGPAGSL